MSRRVPSGPSPRVTGRTIQVAVRLPLALHAALVERGPVAPQIVRAVVRDVAQCAAADPPLDAAAARDAARPALTQEQTDG